ncbi:MFS transporter [Hyphomicrobium sp.]|jgi:MFS family permease|uniref:MFS transporter n=1 Tax=Hyphomicrobium sp. TaxID=82 RepID=UPI0035645ED0
MTYGEVAAKRPLAAGDYKTLVLAALGGALEFYDFIIFVFFANVLGGLFFPPEMPDALRQLQTFGIFAAGYLARPLGGIVMAHFGDLLGRKRMFTFSIVLMAASTLGMGLLPTYAQISIWAPILLLALRIVQGAAIGGEVPGAWVFVSEHLPPGRVGYACGTLTAGLTSGILLGSLVATVVNHVYTPAEISGWAWRLPFLLGGAFGLMSIYLRLLLSETPVFLEMRARKALAAELPLKAVIRDHRGAVIISMLLTWMLSGIIVLVILMTPALLQHQGVPREAILSANTVATLFLTFGCIVGGLIIDRIGPARFFIFGGALLAISAGLFYTKGVADPALLMPLYAVTGFFVGIVGGVPVVMVRVFPPSVRFSGLSFSYNVAYAVSGGLTPVVVPPLMQIHPLAHIYYVLFLCALGMGVGLWLLRSQTSTSPREALDVSPRNQA